MDDFDQLLEDVSPVGVKTVLPKSQNVNINNVGNIRPIGKSTGFQQMATPEEGIKAIDENLKVYGEKHGINTLRGVISRWAPPSENDTESYIKNVSQKTGIKPDEKIDLSDPVIRHILSGPIILQEKGLKNIVQKTPNLQATQQIKQAEPTQTGDEFEQLLTNAQPIVKEPGKFAIEKFTEPLKSISYEDWQKHSVLAPYLNYRQHKTPDTAQALIDAVTPIAKGIQTAVAHPIDTATAIAKALYQNPLGAAAEALKSTLYDPEQLLLLGVGGKTVEKGAIKTAGTVESELAKQLQAKQIAPGMVNAGAAVSPTEAVARNAIANAPPHIQEALKNVNPASLSPTDIKVLESHTKAHKFNIGLTEGEALGDSTLLSQEKNDRLKDPNLQARFEERDPKLIQ
jgi:hypothetical protein